MSSQTKKFRTAIIGSGLICPFHIAGIRRSGLAEVVALCDLNEQRARQLATQFGIPHVVRQVEDLKDLHIDVIHVATPPNTHAALTLQALDQGCHVFVEKPLATSVEQCDAIRQKSLTVNRQVCTNHSNLWDPFIARAINAVHRGRIGELQSVTYLRSSTYPPYPGGDLPPHYVEGGFPFRDIGVHALYIYQALLGTIQSVESRFAHRGTDPNLMFDDWTGTVNCERGTGLFHLSWNLQPLQNVLILSGTRGVIRCDPFSMFVSTRRRTRMPGAADRLLLPIWEACQVLTQVPWNLGKTLIGRLRRYHGVQAAIHEFYLHLHRGEAAPVTLEDATEAVRWTEHVAGQADREKQLSLSRVPAAREADVLVTGGTGFIGRHLVNTLLEQTGRIRILTRGLPPAELLANDRLEFVIGDLGDPQTVERAVEGVSLVYHLGAAMKGGRADYERSTELGTQLLVDAILRRPNIHLVYVSSLSVLHSSRAKPSDRITEEWPLEPHPERRGYYTISKLRAEQYVSKAVRDRGLQAVIIRPGRVFGPDSELLTSSVGYRIGSWFVVLGNGKVPIPFIYVQDLVDALVSAGNQGPFDGSIVQIVDTTATIDQNALLSRLRHHRGHRVVRVPRPIVYAIAFGMQTAFGILGRNAPLNMYRVRSALSQLRFNTDRARTVLNWTPSVGVDRGLEKCAAMHEQIPASSL